MSTEIKIHNAKHNVSMSIGGSCGSGFDSDCLEYLEDHADDYFTFPTATLVTELGTYTVVLQHNVTGSSLKAFRCSFKSHAPNKPSH